MISIQEAKDIIAQVVSVLEAEVVSLDQAHGKVLSKAIMAPIPLPVFDNSAMDGYAICTTDSEPRTVIGEVQAGTAILPEVRPGTAVRIFTGAPIPPGADAVVMQEQTTRNGDLLTVSDDKMHPGRHIRKAGEELEKGALAMEAGTVLTAAGIGMLAMLGLTTVSVYRTPTITIANTGNELVSPGEKLKPGQIYESNSAALRAALVAAGLTQVNVIRIEDSLEATKQQLASALQNSDVVLVTGGISVGDYDFVGAVMPDLGVTEQFYKVNQRPGKPLFFGTKGQKLVFGLPGNPASALVCFYQYALPAIRKLMGHTRIFPPAEKLPLSHPLTKTFDRPCFYRALAQNGNVTSLEGQGSHMMRSFALANCLLLVGEGAVNLGVGDVVEVVRV